MANLKVYDGVGGPALNAVERCDWPDECEYCGVNQENRGKCQFCGAPMLPPRYKITSTPWLDNKYIDAMLRRLSTLEKILYEERGIYE